MKSKSQTPRRLHHHLHAFGKKPHRRDQLRIADGQHVINIALDDAEGVFAQMLRLRAIGNRFRRGDVHDAAGTHPAGVSTAAGSRKQAFKVYTKSHFTLASRWLQSASTLKTLRRTPSALPNSPLS